MKGILSKTENGWVVNYHFSVNNNDWETLPLHPDFIEMMDTCFTSKFTHEVEFEEITEDIVNPIDKHLIKFTYAKLIHHPVDTNEMINHIVEANEMVCMFEPTTDTSSATVCKWCGREKFLHNQVPDVRKMVEGDVWKAGLEDELNKLPYTKHLDDGQYNDGVLSGFELGATWGYNIAKEKSENPINLFTMEDMLKCWNTAYVDAMSIDEYDYKPTFFEDFIQSLKQPEQ